MSPSRRGIQTPIDRRRPRGFTLAEMVLSAAIMAILATGMVSAVLIAGKALPSQEDLTRSDSQAVSITEQIAGDLALATAISTAAGRAIKFTVPDRSHGSAGEETIHYKWSGVAGDPLTRQYNGGTVVTIASSVQDFTLSYATTTTELSGPPRVLFLAGDMFGGIDAEDQERYDLMSNWGFSIQMLDGGANSATIKAAVEDSDVVYMSETYFCFSFPSSLYNMSVGILIECTMAYSPFGIAQSGDLYWGTQIGILDNTHEITKDFATGSLNICGWSQSLGKATGEYAPGADLLASVSNGMGLMAIDAGKTLRGGDAARARRVKLPVGGDLWDHFEVSNLTDDGRTIMRNSIVWAAAPIVYAGVTIDLQTSTDTASRATRQVQLINTPEISKP